MSRSGCDSLFPEGKISASHRSGIGGTVRETGTVENFNLNTSTFVARFTAPQGKPYYAGAVQIKIVDDDHLAVTWKEGGSTEHLTLERDKAPQK